MLSKPCSLALILKQKKTQCNVYCITKIANKVIYLNDYEINNFVLGRNETDIHFERQQMKTNACSNEVYYIKRNALFRAAFESFVFYMICHEKFVQLSVHASNRIKLSFYIF